jgi:hypothetical protein
MWVFLVLASVEIRHCDGRMWNIALIGGNQDLSQNIGQFHESVLASYAQPPVEMGVPW